MAADIFGDCFSIAKIRFGIDVEAVGIFFTVRNVQNASAEAGSAAS